MLGSGAVYYEGKSFVERAKRAWDSYEEAWGLGPAKGPGSSGISGVMWWDLDHF